MWAECARRVPFPMPENEPEAHTIRMPFAKQATSSSEASELEAGSDATGPQKDCKTKPPTY